MQKPKLLLICALALCSAPAWADKKAISPPEFGRQGATALPFSPAILVDGTLYVSGQVGGDLKTRKIPDEFEAEVKTCLDNIGIILKAAGMSYEDVVSVQIYMTDMTLFQRMNAVYSSVFKEPRPSRTTVGVAKLPSATAHIEISVTSRKSQ
ncbi:MAG TPA: RidA family protein [Bryobacteraceae bacterium]|nr:RidA family protein [Bryobacteraceae bacterium]